jgi:hypothetical protein
LHHNLNNKKMKLKLLFGALMLTAVTANAQLSTINENFNNFTPGSNIFPQNNWSSVMAPNPLPNPPAPIMIVTGGPDKAVQVYSGNNTNQPSYLITPQIVAPTGTKSISFIATLASPSPGPGIIQVGLASSPTDMSTFVAVGDPIIASVVGTVINVNVPIPSSALTYLVIRVTPTSNHVAVQLDNVVYDLASSLSVSDDLKNSKDVKFAVNNENSALEFVGKIQPKTVEIYSAAGQQVAAGKVNNGQFDITTLQSGVYYILIETTEAKAIKSKFIKK